MSNKRNTERSKPTKGKPKPKPAPTGTDWPGPRLVPTVTLKHLAATLAEGHHMPKKQAEAVLGELVGLVATHLKKGDRVRIGGLGILSVRKRAARKGRNP